MIVLSHPVVKTNYLNRVYKSNPTLQYKFHSLTGFPRTVAQAIMLDSQYEISLAIELEVPEHEIIRRVKNRWVHLPSGRVYNIGFNDPKVPVSIIFMHHSQKKL